MSEIIVQMNLLKHEVIEEHLPIEIEEKVLKIIDEHMKEILLFTRREKQEMIKTEKKLRDQNLALQRALRKAYGKNSNSLIWHIRNKQRLEEKIERDALTGLMTPEAFKEHTVKRLRFERRKLESHWMVVGVADFANFKYINDTFGHTAGNMVLKESAGIFMEQIRLNDSLIDRAQGIGRWGGDEFCYVLFLNNPEYAKSIGERIRRKIKGHDWYSKIPGLEVEIDIGAVVGSPRARDFTADSVKKLLELADALMYVSKNLRATEGKRGVIVDGFQHSEGGIHQIPLSELLKKRRKSDYL